MPYSVKVFVCAGCGEWFYRAKPKDWHPLCLNCAIKKSINNMHSMMYRTGPAYAKWAAGMERAARQARERIEEIAKLEKDVSS